MSRPLVSIITANYNKAAYIEQTLASVISQTYTSWELILVDDASTDTSLGVISGFLSDARIRLVKEEVNRGGNYCRNKGLGLAKGEYLVFLDSDDLLAPQCLSSRVEAALAAPASNLLVFSMGVFYKLPGDAEGAWTPVSRQPLKDFLRHNLPWSILQPLWKREFLVKLGGFDESFLRLQDVELNTRALLDPQARCKLLPGGPDCYYRIDEARKNFDHFAFLDRWVSSAIQYCIKMEGLVPEPLIPSLAGTIFQTHFQVLYHFKLKQITAAEFGELERKLLNSPAALALTSAKKRIFSVSRFYNLRLPRIPGFNRLLKSLLLA